MNVFGKPLGDYIKFEKVFLTVTVVVGLIRLGLTLSGVPNAVVTWFSMTALTLFGVVYLSIHVERSGFGTYKHLFVLLALQLAFSGVIIAAGITIAGVTGVSNIFQIDSPNANPIAHAAQHLLGGPTIQAFVLWLPASLIMFGAKKIGLGRPAAVAH